MESGRRFEAAVFIDATYEGDLMAKSGVKYIVGRESNSVYGERFNGARRRMWDHANGGEFGAHFPRAVDPFIRPGDRSSGLLFGVQEETIPEDGAGDRKVQAYMFRLCLTDVPENQAPFRKPVGYDPRRYELLLRLLLSQKRFDELPGLPDPDHPVLGMNTTAKLMPNRKTDLNTKGGAGADYVGGNWDYPEASHEKRDRIWKDHIEYQQGLIWFVATDPRVPERYQLPMKSWGYAADEFPDTDHWPHQLYIREARRMIGEYVMTEHTCQGQDTPADAIGLASYAIDSHMTSRYVDEKGRVQNEGHILTSGLKPYPVSYRAITPKAAECENLLVPVCLSASHTVLRLHSDGAGVHDPGRERRHGGRSCRGPSFVCAAGSLFRVARASAQRQTTTVMGLISRITAVSLISGGLFGIDNPALLPIQDDPALPRAFC